MAPKKETPRWKRKPAPAPAMIQMRGREGRALARQMTKALAAQTVAGQVVTPAPVPGSALAARTGAYRYRKQVPPFVWAAALWVTGLGMHHAHALRAALLTALCSAVVMVLFSRHLSRFARNAAAAVAALTALWLPLLAAFGIGPAVSGARPLPLLLTACCLSVIIPWCRHYEWRAPEPEKKRKDPPPTDEEIWDRLAAKKRWTGRLTTPRDLPGGGRQYDILLDGAETHIGQVMTEPRAIAAAWHKPITQAYAEPALTGIESRGLLTILPRNTLEKDREWDGEGIDLATGTARVGWFPDGQPAHERYFIPMSGVRHTMIAGADGSGKTGLLDLGLCLSATSGIISPVILDPQEGQALPAWKDHVPYACGVDECMAFLQGLHAALLDRSRYLGSLRWTTEDGDERKGMGFFDAHLTGLPIIEITLDESPALLTDAKHGDRAAWLLGDIGKRGRKVGFRLRLAAQVPSLAEMRAQALRSMLVGGNVFCGRTGDRVSGGMVGIAADPHDLPKYFPDGKPTVGLGYASGPDNRPSTPMRWMWTSDPYKVARTADIRPLDERTAAAMARFQPEVQETLAPSVPHLVPAAVADDDAPEGRTASDAILAVLQDAGRALECGEIAKRCAALATGDWGRAKPFSIRAIRNALDAMEHDRIEKLDGSKPAAYRLTRTLLHAVAGTSGTDAAASEG